MKIITTIFLLTIMFLQTFSAFVSQVAYSLNKGYIARALCINKEKPKMHCNGKCYLARQLKEQEKHEQQAPTAKKEGFQGQPFFLPDQITIVNVVVSATMKHHYTLLLIRSPFLRSVFHPPSVASA